MKALQIKRFGEPEDVLELVEIPDITPGPDEVRVRINAAGINPSDAMNVRGRFMATKLPRIVGRDFAGTVVDGPEEIVGLPVWGSGGDIGFTVDGSHAEFINIPTTAVALRPANLSSEEAAAVGVPFVTAWSAIDSAGLRPDGWVIVSGAAGAVGSAAVELAFARNAHIIALIKDESERAGVDLDKVEAVAQSDRGDLAEVVAEATDGRGTDVILNGIGAAVFPHFLKSLAEDGRMVVYSVAFGGHEASLDLFEFYRRRYHLIGLNTSAIDVVKGARILAQLKPLFENGALNKPRIVKSYSLEESAMAYAHAMSANGKVVFSV